MEEIKRYTTAYLEGEMTLLEWRNHLILLLVKTEDEAIINKLAFAIDGIDRNKE